MRRFNLGLRGLGSLPLLFVAVFLLVVGGCVHRFRVAQLEEVPRSPGPTTVRSPVKAHLADGSLVVYRNGLVIDGDQLSGSGLRFDALRRDSVPAGVIPMDSVLGLETFTYQVDALNSFATSVVATAGILALTVGGIVAIACIMDPKCFGSCPTVYTATASGELLEAELFSYSIAPLLESRDVDVLAATAGADGKVRLEIRNEALETHTINHLELLEVRHGREESVVPDGRGRPLILGRRSALPHARDRAGRDLRALLANRDSLLFSSERGLLDRISVTDFRDHIDLTLPRPQGRDSVAVVLRLRNSLLNTVLFYDLMLGSAGAQALDWLGHDLQRIGPAVELGHWYTQRLGLWVSVEDSGAFRSVERLPDAGPIAWKDFAVLVPVPQQGDSMRVRLSFVTDEWRIDQIAVALDARRAEPRRVPIAAVEDNTGQSSAEALRRLAEADEEYVQTGPGSAFTVYFEAGVSADRTTRTFLLSSQGFYTEWIRPDWIRGGSNATAFAATDETLVEALRRWRTVRPEFEQRFYQTRIPVR